MFAGFYEMTQKLNILLSNKNGFECITLPTLERLSFVDLQDIDRCIMGEGGLEIMADGAKVDVSRRRKDAFLELMAAQ